MNALTLQNPAFGAYAIAAALMNLKGVGMSWLTVFRMMKVNGGFRSPEDIRKTTFNPHPNPGQLAPNDYVDRIRRIQLNDVESLPYFLVAGLVFVVTDPPSHARTRSALRLRRDAPASFRGLFHRADA
jgi:glutathione S-transferase